MLLRNPRNRFGSAQLIRRPFCVTKIFILENFPDFENFTEEPNLIKPFYQDYFPAIDTLIVNNAENFTHSPWNENRPINDTNYWDRKLDYLFTNIDGFSNGKTHQEAKLHSDHAPVSATLTFP